MTVDKRGWFREGRYRVCQRGKNVTRYDDQQQPFKSRFITAFQSLAFYFIITSVSANDPADPGQRKHKSQNFKSGEELKKDSRRTGDHCQDAHCS